MRVFLGLFIILGLHPAQAQQKQAVKVGTVVKILGAKGQNSHRIPRARKTKYRLNNDDSIFEGDTIITDKGSFIKILMQDDTVMSLGPRSEFQIQYFQMNSSNKSDRKSLYKLAKGKMRALFTLKAKNSKDLQIVTPTVSMGVRGTEILSDVYAFEGVTRTDVALLSGRMQLTNLGNSQSFQMNVGQAISMPKLSPEKKLSFKPQLLNQASLQALRQNSRGFLPRLKNKMGKKFNLNQSIKNNFQAPKVKLKNRQRGSSLQKKSSTRPSQQTPQSRRPLNDSAKQAIKEHKRMVQGLGARGRQYRKRPNPKFLTNPPPLNVLCAETPSHPSCPGNGTP